MAKKLLESSAVSAFCDSIATMLSAGIQTEEAVYMLAEKREQSHFKTVCDGVYAKLIHGAGLATAMESTGAFPEYAVEMVRIGEASGRIERALRSLGRHYDSEGRIFNKLRNAVVYPAALLCIMSCILIFTVAFILPTFTDAYSNISGSLTSGSFSMIGASAVIGWIALVVVLVATAIALAVAVLARTETGRIRVIKMFEKYPLTRDAMYQLAVSRFASALSAFVASGVQDGIAVERAAAAVDHDELSAKLQRAHQSMVSLDNPRSLGQAINENNVFEPIYGRMLTVGIHSGSADEVLGQLAGIFFDDAISQLDAVVDNVEPVLAGFLTVAVGATLIAVMLPLIGIMGSIA